MYEAILQPPAVIGEQFVTITKDSFELRMRVQCMGPGYSNTAPTTNPAILMEVGGGSAGYDLIGLQMKLANDYTVCTYDRAGYGKSY